MELNDNPKRHFDILCSQIIKSKEIQEFSPDFLYSLDYFDRDLYSYPEIDWEETIQKTISSLEELKEIVELRIAERLQKGYSQEPNQLPFPEPSDLDFEHQDLSFEPAEKPLENETLNFDYIEFIKGTYSGIFNWIDKNIDSLKKCNEFFQKYAGAPPYNYPLYKAKKIPFFGGVNDFAVFFNLLELHGNFFLTERSDQSSQIQKFKNPIEKENPQEDIITANSELHQWKMKKHEFYETLAQNFFLVDAEKKSINYKNKNKQFQEKHIQIKTLTTKAAGESMPEISDVTVRNFIDSFNKIVDRLKKIQGVKDPD